MSEAGSRLHEGLERHPDGAVAARILGAALAAVDPGACVERALRVEADAVVAEDQRMELRPGARVWLLAVGKAAAAMARAAVPRLGTRLEGGLAVVKHLPAEAIDPQGRIAVARGAHPIPDERSEAAGRAVIELARRAGPDDLLVVLLSGGASSLMVAPVPGRSLPELARLGDQLLRSGVPIEEINRRRSQLDRLKAGGLRRLAEPTRVLTLVLSDVTGAPSSVVGSGPSVPGPLVELASNDTAVAAAMRAVVAEGWRAEPWPPLRGEARALGRRLARRLRDACPREPTAFVAGGETTVTMRGHGRGGRNQSLALAALPELAGAEGRLLVTLATDGEDGPTDAAGAVVTGDSAVRAAALGLDPVAHLDDDDAYPVFEALGDLLRIGPTGTNVCDLVLALARP
ncbi:MAG: DUF4147 domain-containing protein [Myxococcales bacterium]|nr:DUF4147 domain-containing protein [Myxococcales bacterium]MCB9715507.1 DUF4147 domain-containing protein [Myxococcales bacterium]